MKMKKCLLLLLTVCLAFSLLCIGVAAHAEETTEEATGVFGTNLSVGDFVSLCIAGVALLVVIVLCIVKREKLAESLRAYKREMKNVTWFSWKNVVRSTVFVIVAIVVVAAVIGLLDYAFFQGQYLLVDLLGG